ncbi:MAG: hypothetical protein COR54_05325 [Elusimicrobia bacterium CG22_combo_CG10-13_8_21_14_all_63_91]|nr:MAG: hypothetical protein COR54_05325 [Elusimicrobia bacterium CG22_combo_CG10-13_8_21_14_all_63_91]
MFFVWLIKVSFPLGKGHGFGGGFDADTSLTGFAWGAEDSDKAVHALLHRIKSGAVGQWDSAGL